MSLQITPVCEFFLETDPSVFCPDYGSSDCPLSLDSDVLACPKTKRAAEGQNVDFSLPSGGARFKPSCSSCAHLASWKGWKGAHLCGLEMYNDRYKEVELTDVCERWLYDV